VWYSYSDICIRQGALHETKLYVMCPEELPAQPLQVERFLHQPSKQLGSTHFEDEQLISSFYNNTGLQLE
jgi:hypothetical protein